VNGSKSFSRKAAKTPRFKGKSFSSGVKVKPKNFDFGCALLGGFAALRDKTF